MPWPLESTMHQMVITTRLSLISMMMGLVAAFCSSTAAAVNLVTNPGFESGSSPMPWASYQGSTVSTTTTNEYAGTRAGRSSSRTNTAHGLQQSLLNSGWTAGKYYNVSAWMRTSSSTAQTVTMGVEKRKTALPIPLR